MTDSKKPRPEQPKESSEDPLYVDDLDEQSVDGAQVKGGRLPETHGCPKLPPRPEI
jgi:hypothetical protein